MSDRTVMFIGAVLFVWVASLSLDILVFSATNNHPDNTWAHALANLRHGKESA